MLNSSLASVIPTIIFACLIFGCNATSSDVTNDNGNSGLATGGSGSQGSGGSGGSRASSGGGGDTSASTGGSPNDSSGSGGTGQRMAERSCGFVETTRLVCDGDNSVTRTHNYDLCLADEGGCSTPEGGEVENASCYSNWNYTPVYFEGTCDDWHAYWGGDNSYDCLVDDHCPSDGRCTAFQCICDGGPCPDPTPANPTDGSGGTSTGGNGGSSPGSGGQPTTPSGSGGTSTAGDGGPEPPGASGGNSTAGEPSPPGG